MKHYLYFVIAGLLVLSYQCAESGPTFQEKLESAVNERYPDSDVKNVTLIDSIPTKVLEDKKLKIEGANSENTRLRNEIWNGYSKLNDLDIDMQLASGNEKSMLQKEFTKQKQKMDAYEMSIDELDSLNAVNEITLSFIDEALSIVRMNDDIAYYHVSADIDGKKKYLALSAISSQDFTVIGSEDIPILSK